MKNKQSIASGNSIFGTEQMDKRKDLLVIHGNGCIFNQP